jgi:hypothetical protein
MEPLILTAEVNCAGRIVAGATGSFAIISDP